MPTGAEPDSRKRCCRHRSSSATPGAVERMAAAPHGCRSTRPTGAGRPRRRCLQAKAAAMLDAFTDVPAIVSRVSVAKLNILGVELDERLDEAGFRHVAATVGSRLGARRIGASVYQAEAGPPTSPPHYPPRREE